MCVRPDSRPLIVLKVRIVLRYTFVPTGKGVEWATFVSEATSIGVALFTGLGGSSYASCVSSSGAIVICLLIKVGIFYKKPYHD